MTMVELRDIPSRAEAFLLLPLPFTDYPGYNMEKCLATAISHMYSTIRNAIT